MSEIVARKIGWVQTADYVLRSDAGHVEAQAQVFRNDTLVASQGCLLVERRTEKTDDGDTHVSYTGSIRWADHLTLRFRNLTEVEQAIAGLRTLESEWARLLDEDLSDAEPWPPVEASAVERET